MPKRSTVEIGRSKANGLHSNIWAKTLCDVLLWTVMILSLGHIFLDTVLTDIIRY